MKLRQENKQIETTEIGSDFAERKEAAAILAAPKEYFTIDDFANEEILILPDWQKKILQQCLEYVENGHTVSQEEAHKFFEQCLA